MKATDAKDANMNGFPERKKKHQLSVQNVSPHTGINLRKNEKRISSTNIKKDIHSLI